MRLKKDIIIPSGTELLPAPARRDFGADAHEATVALNNDATASLTIWIDDPDMERWVQP